MESRPVKPPDSSRLVRHVVLAALVVAFPVGVAVAADAPQIFFLYLIVGPLAAYLLYRYDWKDKALEENLRKIEFLWHGDNPSSVPATNVRAFPYEGRRCLAFTSLVGPEKEPTRHLAIPLRRNAERIRMLRKNYSLTPSSLAETYALPSATPDAISSVMAKHLEQDGTLMDWYCTGTALICRVGTVSDDACPEFELDDQDLQTLMELAQVLEELESPQRAPLDLPTPQTRQWRPQLGGATSASSPTG